MESTPAVTHARTLALTCAMQSLVGVLSEEQYTAFIKNWERNQTAVKNLFAASAKNQPTPELLLATSQLSEALDRMDAALHEARNMPMKPL